MADGRTEIAPSFVEATNTQGKTKFWNHAEHQLTINFKSSLNSTWFIPPTE